MTEFQQVEVDGQNKQEMWPGLACGNGASVNRYTGWPTTVLNIPITDICVRSGVDGPKIAISLKL